MQNRYLTKLSEKKDAPFQPRKHHLEALKKLDIEGGVVVDHSPGSGKTTMYAQAIARAQAKDPSGKTLVVAPASLTTNLEEQAKKHGIKIDFSKVESLSYEKARERGPELRKNKYLISILDEGHRVRNFDSKTYKELEETVKNSKQRVIGTGTSMYNHPRDIAPLVNLAAGHDVLPKGKAFDNEFVEKRLESAPILQRILGADPKEVHTLKNKGRLKKVLNDYVHQYDSKDDPSMRKHFPTESEKIIEVPMDSTQETLYKYMEGKLPWAIRMKVRAGLPLDKKESAQLNSFSSGVRQVSNSVNAFLPSYDHTSPKIQSMIESLEQKHNGDPNFKGLVYSNYLHSGLKDYSKELSKRGIKHNMFVGSMSKAEKDKAKEEYNSGKVKVLLVSSAGSEGLDLKGTKLVQVMEPHFNRSKVTQVMGRGARFGSHDALPEKERHVTTEHYHSVFKPGIFGKAKSHSIDQYLHHNSKTKDDLGDQVKALVKS